ncbi:MAG: GWxTD domain-containing protein [Calditrichaeota bacterium]|nr:GWxTD domain-containing protein [Calditrichota bacterium]
MLRKVFVGLLCVFFAGSSFLHAAERVTVRFDVCQFRFNQDTSLVEINYGLIGPKDKAENGVSYLLELKILKDQKPVIHNFWRLNWTRQNGTHEMMVDALRFLLPPGGYQIKLIAKNPGNPSDTDSATVTRFTVRTFGGEKVSLSDIEVARLISPQKKNQNTLFSKNGFEVIPNPLLLFDRKNPEMYYYFEIYNLGKNFHGKYYWLKRTVLNSRGLPVLSLPGYTKKKVIRGNDDIEIGQIQTAYLPSGRYYLHFSVVDSAEREIASNNATFTVYQTRVQSANRRSLPVESRMMSSEIALLSPKNVNVALNATRYFLTDEQKKIVDQLNSERAKRIFLYQFWKSHDSNMETPQLETFLEFMKRIQYSNLKFGETNKAGWQTDRGRVYILYGKPSEIQYYSNVAGFREFQAWSYDNIEHGVVFIFGATGRFGELKLIHSTKTGEIHNEGWLDLLKVAQGSTGLSDMAPGIDQREAIRAMFRRYNLEIPRFLLK